MKKRIQILAVTLFTFGFLSAQSVNFVNGTWEEVKAKAKSEKKFLFVDCYTEWCGFCKLLDKNTFSNEKVGEIMNAKFVSVKIDMEKDYGINLGMKYRVNAFPTALIFNPEGQLVYRLMGYAEPEQYIVSIKKAMDPATQMNFKGVTDKVDLGFPQFYKDAFAGNGKRKWPEEKTVTDFLDQQKDLFDEVSWSVIAICGGGDKYQQYFLSNLKKYIDLYGSEAEDKVSYILYQKLDAAVKEKNENKFRECLDGIEKYIPVADRENTLQSFKLSFFSGIEEWKSFAQEFEFYVQKTGYSNAGMINSYCWGIYEKCDDQEIISKACNWMKKATEKDSQYAYLDTYAALLYKNKEYAEAERVAVVAISTGKNAGEDVKTTEELLDKIKAASK
jgi:thioredoxin-related protein